MTNISTLLKNYEPESPSIPKIELKNKDIELINHLGALLETNEKDIEDAKSLYLRAKETNIVKGYSLENIIAGAIVAVSRINNIYPITWAEVFYICGGSEGVDWKKAKNVSYELKSQLDLNPQKVEPEKLIPRLASRLSLPREVENTAYDIIDKYNEKSTHAREPSGVACGAMYIATCKHRIKRTQAEIAEGFCTEVTVRTIYKEMLKVDTINLDSV